MSETLDAFHRGAFYLLQPAKGAHRAGMDAMLLASLVADERPVRVADLGAGAGAAGLAVAARLPNAQVVLVERSPEMAQFARRNCGIEQNQTFGHRLTVVEVDVTLRGKARVEAGLSDGYFDHVIMNPPFNDGRDRRAPEALKAEAHAMTDDLFESWIRTAGAITMPGGQLSLIARPSSVADIISACGKRFGGLELTAIHPRPGEDAIRLLVTAIKGSRSRLVWRAPLFVHGEEGHAFAPIVDALNNGRKAYVRKGR